MVKVMTVDKTVWRHCFDLYAESLDRLGEPDFWDGFFWPRVNTITAKHEGDELCAGILCEIHQEIERQRKRISR